MFKCISYGLLAAVYAKMLPPAACAIVTISVYVALAVLELWQCKWFLRLRRQWRKSER